MHAIRILLQAGIDYAELFPPAGLTMAQSVQHYADYRASARAWALGRFIAPVSRLAEFDAAAEPRLPRRPEGAPWPIAALLGGSVAADLESLGEFNCRHAANTAGAA